MYQNDFLNITDIHCERMPPKAVKTIRDLIYWQYAKLISHSVGYGKKNYGFVMDRFQKLKHGEIEWSGSIREWVKEREDSGICIYCGERIALCTDHLIPKSRGGLDIGDNAATACVTCNTSRGDKGIYEWFGLREKDEVPRIVEGKYLKLLYQLHERNGTLDIDRKTLKSLCESCDIGYLCKTTTLTVYCLESILGKITEPR